MLKPLSLTAGSLRDQSLAERCIQKRWSATRLLRRDLTTYLRFYKQQWSKLVDSNHLTDAPLQEYSDRSVWTTWVISYQAIREKHEGTANLLLLWSYLDNKDLWHGLFAAACRRSTVAMQLLRNYSLVEEVAESRSYATHPIVHQWAHHSQGKHIALKLIQLVVVAVGWTVPESSTRDYSVLQRRLLPHAQACSKWILESKASWCLRDDKGNDGDLEKGEERETVLGAIHQLGNLYKDQGKLREAEQMYERALRGREEALGPSHTSTLSTVNNLGSLYADQGKLREAEQMYERALQGYKEALGEDGVQQYMPALNTLQNIGDLYVNQGETAKAQAMYARTLSGLRLVLGQSSDRCIGLAAKLDALPTSQRGRGKQQKLSAVGESPELRHDERKKSFRLLMQKLAKKVF
ncbi:hypothetical protein EJ02DRAFT_357955 [Clathrospora elynae]|uniref:Uncharacterized protein n=1 Tax=Clathrospora elynae TaxID=706981 RepID=A0A6A5SA88_9PLEO|nr:hypothetical protein EJ02DRAFT_357955 [Clathrospora elynae]